MNPYYKNKVIVISADGQESLSSNDGSNKTKGPKYIATEKQPEAADTTSIESKDNESKNRLPYKTKIEIQSQENLK